MSGPCKSPAEVCEAIQYILSGTDWTPDMFDEIAAELRAGGYDVEEPKDGGDIDGPEQDAVNALQHPGVPWCFPNGARAPGHVPENHDCTLYTAMGALYEELSSIEIDIAEGEGRGLSTTLRGQALLKSWEKAHDSVSAFFDINVYLDRPHNNEVSQ